MKIRKHRRMLDESMETMEEIEPTLAAVAEYLNKDNGMPFSEEELATLSLREYGGKDDRIGWEATYIVLINGQAVGFADQQCVDDWKGSLKPEFAFDSTSQTQAIKHYPEMQIVKETNGGT